MFKVIFRLGVFSTCFAFFLFFITDVSNHHSLMKSSYETPWYDNNYFTQPYTMFKLFGETYTQNWEYNNTMSEKWLVREIQYKDKTYWTIIERINNKG